MFLVLPNTFSADTFANTSSAAVTNNDDNSMDASPPSAAGASSILPAMNTLNLLTSEATNVLQSATNQLINAQTLEILGQIDNCATHPSSNSLGHSRRSPNNFTMKPYADDDDDDNDDEPSNDIRTDRRRRSSSGHRGDSDSSNEHANDEPPPSSLPLLDDTEIAFNLHTPPTVPAYLNLYYVCECGSRLLFLSVHWVKQIGAFRACSDEAQNALLNRSWTALFVLGLAQCANTISLATIWTSMVAAVKLEMDEERMTAMRCKMLAEQVGELQAAVQAIVRMRLDEREFAYVKLVALFGVGK